MLIYSPILTYSIKCGDTLVAKTLNYFPAYLSSHKKLGSFYQTTTFLNDNESEI